MVLTGSATISAPALGEVLVTESKALYDFPVLHTSYSPQHLASLFQVTKEVLASGIVASIQPRGIYVGLQDTSHELLSLGSRSSTNRDDNKSHDHLIGIHSPLVGGFGDDDLLSSATGETGVILSNISEQDVANSLTQLLESGAVELFQELSTGVEQSHEVQQVRSVYATEAVTAVAQTTHDSFEGISLPNPEEYSETSCAILDEATLERPSPNLTFPQLSELTEQELDSGQARFKRALGQGAQIQINIQKPIPSGTDQGAQLGGITPAAIVAAIILTTSGAKAVKDWLGNHQK